MNVLDAAYQVLKEAQKPLHYTEITRLILGKGLWTTKGKTPQNTINAQLVVDINLYGEQSRFCRTGPGTYSLTSRVAAACEKSPPPLSFLDAAEKILDDFGDHQPMHFHDITQKAFELGLIESEGKTPDATMNAAIGNEIRRQTRRGELPRFERLGEGTIGLTKWIQTGLAHDIHQHNDEVKRKLHKQIKEMDPREFEALIGRLLNTIGFESVVITPPSGDNGIDVRGILVVGGVIKTKMAVQVKRWRANVQAPIIQQVRGSLGAHEQGLIITTADFSQGACEEAAQSDKTPIALMNGKQLIDLLIENDIGITRATYDLIDLEHWK